MITCAGKIVCTPSPNMAQMNAEIATWLARRKDVVNFVPDSGARYSRRRSERYFVVLH